MRAHVDEEHLVWTREDEDAFERALRDVRDVHELVNRFVAMVDDEPPSTLPQIPRRSG